MAKQQRIEQEWKSLNDEARVTMKLYAGVDGGGSKTLAIVVDESGREVGRGLAAGSNAQSVGLEAAGKHLHAALNEASGGNLPLAGLCIGLAGVDRPEDREIILATISSLKLVAPEKVWLGNDAELILLSLPDAVGLGLIAGTGSIALGRDRNGQSVRAGGWGYRIGDEGSGYDLGRRAVQAATQAADGRGPQTVLLPTILKEWNLTEPYQLIGTVYHPATTVATFARLTRMVANVASDGDVVAQRLLKRAAYELAIAVEAVAAKLDFGETPPGLALAGGFLLGEKAVRRPLLKRLHRILGITTVRKVREPARYAAQAALERFK